jgi:hypothetical protein
LKLKKYISKRVLIKLGIFLAIITAAWIFDYYYQGNHKTIEKTDSSEQKTAAGSLTCFCTPVFTVSLKTPVQKVPLGKIGQEKLNRLIQEHLIARSFFLSKAEVLQQSYSLLALRYLIPLRCRIVNDPGDQPPLS